MRRGRQEAELSQEMLAEKAGVTARTVINWETGVNFPELSKLPKIASALGVAIPWLFESEQEERSQQNLQEVCAKLDQLYDLVSRQQEELRRLSTLLDRASGRAI